MLIAAGADPRAVHKLEGFGGDIAPLVEDPRVAVVSVTGSAETAKKLQAGRGVRPVKFEGGGCNWAWIDDGFSTTSSKRSPCASRTRSSARVAQVHEPARHRREPQKTLDRIEPLIVAEMKTWKAVKDPRIAPDRRDEVVSPLMVHKASTLTSIQRSGAKRPA
jgi:hypothetical protein